VDGLVLAEERVDPDPREGLVDRAVARVGADLLVEDSSRNFTNSRGIALASAMRRKSSKKPS
jgi:hypothetical protein